MAVKIIKESTSKYPEVVEEVWNELLEDNDEEDLFFTKDQVYNCYKLARSTLYENGYMFDPDAIGTYGFGVRDINYEILKRIYDSNVWDTDETVDRDYFDASIELDKDRYGEFGMMSVGEDQLGKREFVVAYNEL